tara:strand:+ start:263 stop:895 length:633 start_codon:yes stop_codon:yes gene_type:complete
MADFTTANIQGANELLNKTLSDTKTLKDSLASQAGADASAIKSALESKTTDLTSSLSNMIPELPSIPNVNAQSGFSALADFDISTPAGLEQYQTQVANISKDFGTTLADKGLDINSLASQIQAGGDVGSLIPNLQLPDGASLPIELPSNISFPSIPAIDEIISDMPEFSVTIDNDTLKSLGDAAKDAINKSKEEIEKSKKKYTETKLTLT